MSIAHHGGPIYDRPQAPNEHPIRSLSRPIDERRAAGTVPSEHRRHGKRDQPGTGENASPPLANASRVLSRGIANGFCARDSIMTPKCPMHLGRR
jgi:hypothetical protein